MENGCPTSVAGEIEVAELVDVRDEQGAVAVEDIQDL